MTVIAEVKNMTNKSWTVDVKIWLRLPDNNLSSIYAQKITLSQGEQVSKVVYTYTFNGTEKQGIYSLNGRLLNPISDDYLSQSFNNIVFINY